MRKMITERTPFIIAAEINTIKYQTEKILLAGAVEIGHRLTEAKDLVPHGEWSKWLEREVNFAQKTAQNLMRIYEEYGDKQPAALNAGAQAQGLPNLGYTQALILLGIPEEERAQFIDDLDIDSMTTRELKKAVDERKQAEQERDRAEQENADLRKDLDGEKDKNTQLAKERDNLKTKADELQKSKQALEQDVQKKLLENKKLTENSNLKSYNRVSNELTAAQIKLLTGKVAFRYENLDKAFKELTYEMDLLAKIDPQVYAEYKKQVNDFLFRAMKERMGK